MSTVHFTDEEVRQRRYQGPEMNSGHLASGSDVIFRLRNSGVREIDGLETRTSK